MRETGEEEKGKRDNKEMIGGRGSKQGREKQKERKRERGVDKREGQRAG